MKNNVDRLSSPTLNGQQFFHRSVLERLNDFRFPFLIGGGHALKFHSKISREPRDLDVFVRSTDIAVILARLSEHGYETELSFPHWLAKVISGKHFIDIIFNSGNGLCEVNAGWFEHSAPGEVLGVEVDFCPAEELIWTKAFVMERERYDGADIAHIIHACADHLDWQRLLRRFEAHWQVLLSHLILFDFIYPSERSVIPSWLTRDLLGRLESEKGEPTSRNRVCRGTLLSRVQYRDDVENWGYQDARQLPCGSMTAEEAATWTAAADGSRQ